VHALREAQARLDALAAGRYRARVLEPSPPAVHDQPWVADDPVVTTLEDVPAGRTVVSPLSTGEETWDRLARENVELARWCAARWLGAWAPLASIDDVETLHATRRSWQALAEHVLAPARYQASAKIGLRRTRQGFGTPFFVGSDGADVQLRVEGTDVVVDRGDAERRLTISTLGDVARTVGVNLADPPAVYEPTTTVEADERLVVDADAAARLGDWFAFAASVLEELRAAAPDGPATRVQLWPEHFDCSIDLGDDSAGQRGTFGASPGDDGHPLPYLYVTHWADRPADPYWNDPGFGGASLGYEPLTAAADGRETALGFFREGRERLASP
jgi:hypothetical protein